MTENKDTNKKSFGCTAYKIVTVALLLAILGMFFNFITQIKSLRSTFETTAPNLEHSIDEKINIGTKTVLKQLAINEKVSAPNSEIVLEKAKLFEHLRIILEAKIALADGSISEKNIEILDTLQNDKIAKVAKELNKLLSNNSEPIPSDEELAIALLDNIKLITKISLVGRTPLKQKDDTNNSALEKLKAKSMNYLSRLVRVEPTSTNHIEKDSTQKQNKKYQPQDLAYFLLQNSEYTILLEILSKHPLTEEVESILEMAKLKKQIKEHLMQIEQLLLE